MSDTYVLSNLGEELELRIKQGATWDGGEFELLYEDEYGNAGLPVDLTGAVVTMQFRRKGLDTGAPPAEATCTVIAPATAGKFRPTLTATQTASIPAGELLTSKESAYTFDVFVTWAATSVKWELYHGNAFVFRRVTK
jgi:hypothetical protein